MNRLHLNNCRRNTKGILPLKKRLTIAQQRRRAIKMIMRASTDEPGYTYKTWHAENFTDIVRVGL